MVSILKIYYTAEGEGEKKLVGERKKKLWWKKAKRGEENSKTRKDAASWVLFLLVVNVICILLAFHSKQNLLSIISFTSTLLSISHSLFFFFLNTRFKWRIKFYFPFSSQQNKNFFISTMNLLKPFLFLIFTSSFPLRYFLSSLFLEF